jgi:hypothetical protein
VTEKGAGRMPNKNNSLIQPGFSGDRRRVLQAGLGATALFLPMPYAWVYAQSEGTLKLLRAPKFALVIGNSTYKHSPLKNPANDAKAIAATLAKTGFDVSVKVDAVRAEMAEAVTAFTQMLAKSKGVGLFYFAGHGLQLAWRNYMIPVDADIRSTADIQKQGVEVGTLLSGISKAVNPLNVIVLDACRDNPFGNLGGIDQKGLSQMDAPASTLLAYATAPGNVASDGDGINGLYTEHLLKEIAVPDAKVEDVFKRVRLQVRRRTNGQQIPWESTSLEEDFYFVPPKELKKLSEAEEQRRFAQELALWEKIKDSTTPEPLVDYLARFPSSRFSELAQFQLDRALARQGEKKVEVVTDAANPFTKGTVRTDTNYKVGDFFRYRESDLITKQEVRIYGRRVTAIAENEVQFNKGGFITDLLGNFIRNQNVAFTGTQFFLPEYSVGKRWSARYQRKAVDWPARDVSYDFRVLTKEQIVVPAGTFDAYKIEGIGWTLSNDGSTSINLQSYYWIAQGVRRFVALENLNKNSYNRITASERHELLSYEQK